jgi:hypothetical protein
MTKMAIDQRSHGSRYIGTRCRCNARPVQPYEFTVHHVRRQNDKGLDNLPKHAALLFENYVDWPGDPAHDVYSSNGDYED